MGSAFLATILIIIVDNLDTLATFEEKNTLVGYLSILAFWVNTICARLMLKTMNPCNCIQGFALAYILHRLTPERGK